MQKTFKKPLTSLELADLEHESGGGRYTPKQAWHELVRLRASADFVSAISCLFAERDYLRKAISDLQNK